MRAILINPYMQTVTELDTTNDYKAWCALLDAADPKFCGKVERVSMGQGVDLWIDEESALNDGRPVFTFQNGPSFAGVALLFGIDGDNGESRGLPDHVTLAVAKHVVTWTDLYTTGDFEPTVEKEIDHPVFGKTHAIITGDPIYRTTSGYFVYCYDERPEFPGAVEMTLATSVLFRTRGDALAYAATVAPSRKAEVREASII
jgi:hypothetical protein